MTAIIEVFSKAPAWPFEGYLLAFIAFMALHTWKEELKGSNKYRSLMSIKKEFLKFYKSYQTVRVLRTKYIQAISSFKGINDARILRTMRYFIQFEDSVTAFESLGKSYSEFLKEEIVEAATLVHTLKEKYEIYYNTNVSDKEKYEYEKYIFKSVDDDDEVSQRLTKLIEEVFNKTDKEIDGFIKSSMKLLSACFPKVLPRSLKNKITF